ncbi:Replication factor A protein 1, partial [Coemansia erecta]
AATIDDPADASSAESPGNPLAIKIALVVQNLLSAESSSQQLIALKIVQNTVRALINTKDLLPLLNHIWPPLVHRLAKDHDQFYVAAAACDVIDAVCELGEDWMRRRVKDDLWAHFARILREASTALGALKSSERLLVCRVLSTMNTVVQRVSLDDSTSWELSCLAIRFLANSATKDDAVRLLQHMVPAYGDKIWLVLAKLGKTAIDPSTIPCLPGVSSVSLASFHQQQQHYQQQQPQQQHFQQQQQQQSSFMSRMEDTKPSFGASMAPIHTGAPPTVHPIVDLNPYHSKWTIRARVSQKSAIKSWNKPNSSGRLFSVNLLDESGEIRATTFTNQVDRFYPMLEMGKVYYVSNAQVKMARQQFSNVNNQYELTFDDSTVIELCQEQAGVPQEHFDFIPLASLSKFEKNHVVDVLAVVKSVGDLNEITPKSGGDKKMIKRDLVLVDKSGFQVRATLWGDDAQSFSAGSEPVVAFKGFRVGDFGGRSLSLASMGSYTVNPDIPEAHQLRGWYDASGRSLGYQSFGSMGGSSGDMSERNDAQLKTMAQVRVENLGGGANADYFTLKGTIVYIRTNNLSYPACPSEGCNRKVVEDSSTGQWGCEKCARSYPAPEYRYIFSINVSDETGQAWLQCFSEVGQLILGQSANTMKQYEADPASSSQFKKVIDDATFKEYKFRCKARTEQFNETSRVRISVVSAYPVDYVSETKRLSKLIDSFSQQ